MTWRKKKWVSSSVIDLPHAVKLFRLNKARVSKTNLVHGRGEVLC